MLVVLKVVVALSLCGWCEGWFGDWEKEFSDLEGDAYDTLGVAFDAPEEEIKKAYRQLAKRWHPDKNPRDSKATKRFAKLSRAFESVSDKKTRTKYDARSRARASSQPPSFDFEARARDQMSLPPKRSFFERGGYGAAGHVEERFVPKWTARGARRVTRVTSTTLPDGTVLAEAQDYELKNQDWYEIGAPYSYDSEREDLKDRRADASRLEAARAFFLGDVLTSPDGSHTFGLEIDGNARVRESGSRALVWETSPSPSSAAGGDGFLLLQRDGNLLLCAGASPKNLDAVLWSSNSADSSAAAAFLVLNDVGELRIQRRTADNSYAPCAWGSAGCSSLTLSSARNQFRVAIRRVFDRGALRSATSPEGGDTIITSILGFFRFMMGF